MVTLASIVPTALSQHGLITRAQALDVLTEGQFEYLRRTGALPQIHPGVFSLPGAEETYERRCLAAVLSLPGALLSHKAAAWAWGLLSTPDEVHLLVPRSSAARPGVFLHRVTAEEFEPSRSGRWPCTTVSRTLLDVAGEAGLGDAARCLDSALRSKLTTTEQLDEWLRHHARQGRNGTVVLRELITERIERAGAQSHFEHRVLDALESRLRPLVRQYEVNVAGRRYFLDGAWPEWRLAIEVDGPHHDDPTQVSYDKRRDADLVSVGWSTMRCGWQENLGHFTEQVVRAVAQRRFD